MKKQYAKNAYWKYGEAKINDNVLVALTLMTAKSLPQQKDTVIALILECFGDFSSLRGDEVERFGSMDEVLESIK